MIGLIGIKNSFISFTTPMDNTPAHWFRKKVFVIVWRLILFIVWVVWLSTFYMKKSLSMNQQDTLSTGDSADIPYQVVQTGDGLPQSWLDTKVLKIGWVSLVAEVADTSEEQRVGLMFRANLPDKRGMLFVFDTDQQLSFWMQNTYIWLDLLYVWSDGIIKHIHNNAKPLDLTWLPSVEKVKYVIEVNDMFVETFGVKVGDRVEGI